MSRFAKDLGFVDLVQQRLDSEILIQGIQGGSVSLEDDTEEVEVVDAIPDSHTLAPRHTEEYVMQLCTHNP